MAKPQDLTRCEESPALEPIQTIDLENLEQITGGAMRWPLWAYKAGNAIAGMDPAMIAANFIM